MIFVRKSYFKYIQIEIYIRGAFIWQTNGTLPKRFRDFSIPAILTIIFENLILRILFYFCADR